MLMDASLTPITGIQDPNKENFQTAQFMNDKVIIRRGIMCVHRHSVINVPEL